LATTADSWIFVDSRTQTRAECKHPVDASMHFWLVTELHASLMTSSAITIDTYPAESCDYVCFAPLRHYWNSLLRFSFFYSAFLLNEWPIRTCSKITAVLLICTDDDNRSYRNVCNMSFVSFALAVIFIVRLKPITVQLRDSVFFNKVTAM